MKVGVLVVGIRGATGSTLAAAAMTTDEAHVRRFLMTAQGAASSLPLPDVRDLVWGGWDTREERWDETLDRHRVFHSSQRAEMAGALALVHSYPAVALARDHAVVVGESRAARSSGRETLERIRGDIRAFRHATGVDTLVMVYLATPAMLPPPEAWPHTGGQLLEMLEDGVFKTAAPYYFAAAILEGAAVVDYTASATLEMPGLQHLAEQHRVPLAGRDGSTGQTLLKSVLAETFTTRRLKVVGWYSTNILGNHDGFVLQDGRFCDVKKRDKTELLEQILEHPVQSHLVDIRYYEPAGDDKEAWDAIDFETFMGARGQLRVNWRASDSLLAAPAILDLIRLSAYARREGLAGLQPQLGVFFKFPLATPERRYLRLARNLEAFCETESEKWIGGRHDPSPRDVGYST